MRRIPSQNNNDLLLAKQTLTAAATNIIIPNLNVLKHGGYTLEYCGVYNVANAHYGILFNNDTNLANYSGGNRIYGYSNAVHMDSNSPINQIGAVWSAKPCYSVTDITLVNGKAICITRQMLYHSTTNPGWELITLVYATTNISSIMIKSYAIDTTNELVDGIGIGSNIKLFKKL